MLSINNEDLKKLDKLGAGTFGVVYRYDDSLALKVYNPQVKTMFGSLKDNPQLKNKKRALKIKRIGKRIEYSDLVKDILYIDGIYSGIVLPYYNGTTLNHMMNAPLELKIDVSNQLVRNFKELTDHNIYPMDIKLNNIMYVDGEVKIIDLDDYYTKYFLFNIGFYERDCIMGLDETIKTYFGEYRNDDYFKWLGYYLTRTRPEDQYNYFGITNYIDNKEIDYKYLFIDIDSDIDIIKRINSSNDYRIILLYDVNNDKYAEFFKKLDKNKIYVYDMIRRCDFDLYFTNNKAREMQFVKGRECYKK